MGGTGQNSLTAIPKSFHLHLGRHVAAGRENEPARGYRTKITNGLYSARDGPLFEADLSNTASILCPPLVMSKGGREGREQPGPQAGLRAYRRRDGVDVDAVVREFDRHDLGQQVERDLGKAAGAGRQSGSPGYPLTGVICAWGLCPAWGSNLSLEGRNVRAVHHSAAEHQAPADETF